MPKGVVEKQPNRAAVWTFQEAEAVGGSEVDSFNSKVNGKVNILQQQGRKSVRSQTNSSSTLHLWLYLPNAEMTLDLEVNEVEVKGLTSLASVTETTGFCLGTRRAPFEGGASRVSQGKIVAIELVSTNQVN